METANSASNRELVSVQRLEMLPELRPPHDAVLMYLLEQAVGGQVQVYSATIPLDLIDPFDPSYNPSEHPAGRAAIEEVRNGMLEGHLQRAWVYPRGSRFVLSDDYMIWRAATAAGLQGLPCWTLGDPSAIVAKSVRGPLEVRHVAQLLGLARTASGPEKGESVHNSPPPAGTTWVSVKLYAAGKAVGWMLGPEEFKEQAMSALRRALNTEARIRRGRFLDEMREQGVPDEVSEAFLKHSFVDDEAYLMEGYPR